MIVKVAAVALSVVVTTSHSMEDGSQLIRAGLQPASQLALTHIHQYEKPTFDGTNNQGMCGHSVVLACFKKRSSATRWRMKLGVPRLPGETGLVVESTRSYRNLHDGYYCVTRGPYPSQAAARLSVKAGSNNTAIFAKQCRSFVRQAAQK